jgi:hypothetical protein
MPWSKCPRGYKESNYQCYSHDDKNLWCEVYLSDKPPYSFLQWPGGYRGAFFYEASELNEKIKKLS